MANPRGFAYKWFQVRSQPKLHQTDTGRQQQSQQQIRQHRYLQVGGLMRSRRNGATAISHNGACGWKFNVATAKGGPSRRPQLSPELMVASAAIRFSGPDRCIAHVCAAGTMPDTVRPYSARETINPVTPQKALTSPVVIPHTTSAITAKLTR
ncbi:hypothetical protein CPC16_004279 [Podila verticillata]|nr:hypothetical protein CPC16_004279 [Podila verticillata]